MQNIVISRALLDEWRALLETCAQRLQASYQRTNEQYDEDLAVICEETAEYLESLEKVSE